MATARSSTADKPRYPLELPEFLPPILVMELRRGIRSRRFLVWALLLHAMAVILVSARVAGFTPAFEIGWREDEFTFLHLTGLVFCVLLPLNSFRGFEGRRVAVTYEMIRLTGVSPTAVFFATWSVTMLLGAALALSLTPYILFCAIRGFDVIQSMGVGLGIALTFCAATTVVLGASIGRPRFLAICLTFYFGGTLFFCAAGMFNGAMLVIDSDRRYVSLWNLLEVPGLAILYTTIGLVLGAKGLLRVYGTLLPREIITPSYVIICAMLVPLVPVTMGMASDGMRVWGMPAGLGMFGAMIMISALSFLYHRDRRE